MKDLATAYKKYSNKLGLECSISEVHNGTICLEISGTKAPEAFKNESGKHIVQRVPPTEKKGRRHTSVVAVSVMEIPDEIDVTIESSDVLLKTQKGHGKGGQNQNKVESAVRVRHKPTGIEVFINGRDQIHNKKKALGILQERVEQFYRKQFSSEIASNKASQLGGLSRSGKGRTYNFIQGWVEDHNTGQRTTKIKEVMKGNLEIINGNKFTK